MRVLITGASGFAGTWLARACLNAGEQVIGLSRSGHVPTGAQGRAVDLADGAAVRAAVRESAPQVVYHLAALSSVGRSWQEPAQTLQANVVGAAGLLEALRHEAPDARLVWVSSSEVYGTREQLPIAEDAPLHPPSPYAVSKAAGEQLAEVYRLAHGLDVVVARPFSHSGPGQRPIFLLSNITRQAAQGRLLGRDGVARLRVVTGNGATRRDFTDVRDVVRAYRLLAASGLTGVFNVCSGRSISAAEQVAALGRLVAPMEVEHVVDPQLVRASEVMDLRGDPAKLTAATGWRPEIPHAQTMADTLRYWENELAGAPEAPAAD